MLQIGSQGSLVFTIHLRWQFLGLWDFEGVQLHGGLKGASSWARGDVSICAHENLRKYIRCILALIYTHT